jgi:hypothetical protein
VNNPFAQPTSERDDNTPSASDLVAACEEAWAAIQRRHPEVPDAVIVLGTGVERGRLVKLGHWWGGRWIADGNVRGEVLLAGEALHLAPEAVFEVLLHEAAHGMNAARGVQDSSRGGRYHNARFKATAEDLGLIVKNGPPYGWARTSIGPVARGRYDAEIARLGDAMRIARRVTADLRVGETTRAEGADAERNGGTRARHDQQPSATCGCGRRIRMAPSVLAKGPVLCGLCGREFSTSRAVDDRVTSQRDAEGAHDSVQAPIGSVGDSMPESPHGLDLNAMQRAGLADLVKLGTKSEGALLLTKVGAWYAARGGITEDPILGTTPEGVETANLAARAMLKLDGTLREPSVTAGGRELAVGEFVTLRDSIDVILGVDGGDLPPYSVFGTVEHIDATRRELVVDFAAAGRLTLGLDSPEAAALDYGYAEHAGAAGDTSIACRTVSRQREPDPLGVEVSQ